MGKFDGILICSDWDGTLHTQFGVPEKNIEAINYFEAEGGLFTVCTGRRCDHLNDLISGFRINTYTISVNGAQIIDQRSGNILYEGFFDDESIKLAKRIFEIAEGDFYVNVFYKRDEDVVIEKIHSFEEYMSIFESFPIYKLIYCSSKDAVLKARSSLTETGNYSFIRSFETGIELLHKNSMKGIGALRLKNKTNSRMLVSVGNYDNDVDMLEAADISYAVLGSSPEALSAAMYITASANDGAISAVIEDLEKRILPHFNTVI